MEPKNQFVRIGDFFFKYRNLLFPALLVSLFVLRAPATSYFGQEWLETVKDGVAVLVVLAGLALRAAVIGYAYIKRGGLNKQVYADTLVVEGFFAACRNPLYVGNFIIYFGVLLMHGSPLVIVLGMLFFTFVYSAIVAAEEYFLRNKFGLEYESYCRETPRWGFRLDRLKAATEGMEFSIRRVVAKDYSTITNAVFALVGIELIEEIMFYPPDQVQYGLLGGLLVLVVCAAVGVRVLKKRGLLGV